MDSKDEDIALRQFAPTGLLYACFGLVIWAVGILAVVGMVATYAEMNKGFGIIGLLCILPVGGLLFLYGWSSLGNSMARDIISSRGILQIRKGLLPWSREISVETPWSQVKQCYIIRTPQGEIASWKVVLYDDGGSVRSLWLLGNGDMKRVAEIMKRSLPGERLEYVGSSVG